jgi:uncharacterized protein YutE (UPF0331/DUF86 family)
MSPEVIQNKIAAMGRYLYDLSSHRLDDFGMFMDAHYKVERLIELLVMCAADIAFHLMALKAESPPASYRAAFLRLGEIGVLDLELSKRLALGAGLRNILAHEYEEIDYRLLHESVPQVLDDMSQFMDTVAQIRYPISDA